MLPVGTGCRATPRRGYTHCPSTKPRPPISAMTHAASEWSPLATARIRCAHSLPPSPDTLAPLAAAAAARCVAQRPHAPLSGTACPTPPPQPCPLCTRVDTRWCSSTTVRPTPRAPCQPTLSFQINLSPQPVRINVCPPSHDRYLPTTLKKRPALSITTRDRTFWISSQGISVWTPIPASHCKRWPL